MPQRTLDGKGLYTQTRFEGRLLFCSAEQKIQETFPISLVKQPIRIRMPHKVKVHIHKVNKNTCSFFASDKYTFDNIFRHVDPWEDNK